MKKPWGETAVCAQWERAPAGQNRLDRVPTFLSPCLLFPTQLAPKQAEEVSEPRTLGQCSPPVPVLPAAAASSSEVLRPPACPPAGDPMPTPTHAMSLLVSFAPGGHGWATGAAGASRPPVGKQPGGWLGALPAPLPSSFQTPSQGPPSSPQGALLLLLQPIGLGHSGKLVARRPEGPQ